MRSAELSREGQEWRRLRAWALWQQGWKQENIATALGDKNGFHLSPKIQGAILSLIRQTNRVTP